MSKSQFLVFFDKKLLDDAWMLILCKKCLAVFEAEYPYCDCPDCGERYYLE